MSDVRRIKRVRATKEEFDALFRGDIERMGLITRKTGKGTGAGTVFKARFRHPRGSLGRREMAGAASA